MFIIKDEDTIKSLVNILENLEYYLHKYDNAIDFITLKGNDILILCLYFIIFHLQLLLFDMEQIRNIFAPRLKLSEKLPFFGQFAISRRNREISSLEVYLKYRYLICEYKQTILF